MKKILAHPVLILILRLGIGGMFIVASIDKILEPGKFAIAIDNYRFLPELLVKVWAVTLPWIELFVGAFLVLGIFVEASALVSAIMFSSFFIALSAALARGLDISCGCFNLEDAKSNKISALNLLRDFSLIAGSVWILFGHRGKLALESLWVKED